MTRKELIVLTIVLVIASAGAISMASRPIEAQSQRPIPIGRYEFPQDGVVCYRTGQYAHGYGVALSCVKK